MIEITNPENVGMSSRHMNKINATMQDFINQGKYPGIATLIARYGKIVHFGCYGKLELAADQPILAESLFRIYSLTKPITSVAALMLYEQGYFNLDDPVSKWIPEFKNFKVLHESTNFEKELDDLETEITFWHLLTHTSGLGYGYDTEATEPIEEVYREAKLLSPIFALQFPLPEFIQKIAKLPLAAQPGTAWHYSLAHDVLGYLIGLISGKPFDMFLHEHIFEPLDMQDTSFYVPKGKLERFGPLYGPPEENGVSVLLDDVATSPFIRPDIVPSGGVGLISSMPDYFRFMLMLANGGELDGVRLLKQDTVSEMTTNQLTDSVFPVRFSSGLVPDLGFGLGIGVQVTSVPQFGWLGWSGTGAWIYPHEEMIVIAMSQASNWEAIDALTIMAREAITN
jgi:CubicO group peptidase (beta-lactamase class C family)